MPIKSILIIEKPNNAKPEKYHADLADLIAGRFSCWPDCWRGKAMKRKPTAAQKEAAKEKRAKVRAMLKKIAGMSPEQQAELTGGMIKTVEGRTLSLTNQCLVAMQGCRSTIVGGFQQWRRTGRIVRKGEHGLSIWIPSATKDEETGKDDLRFFLGTVFGIDQTEEIEAA